jgi:hypothetical protein
MLTRIVASLTTIPGRNLKLLRTLRSLHAQDHPLDAIYLTVPKQSRRLKQAYPPFPKEILELCTIVPCDYDYGPATKIVGGLIAESDPNTVIITFDDDVVYSPRQVSSMLAYHLKFPNAAIGPSGILLKYGFPFYSTISNCPGNWNRMTGFEVPDNGRSVDALCGFSSVLYVRKFFPTIDKLHDEFLKYTLMDDDVYFNDDIMISAYLSKYNIDRRVVPNIPFTNEGKIDDPEVDAADTNAISFDKIKFLQRFRSSINKVTEWGFFAQKQPVSLNETIGGHIGIVVVLIILLLFLLYISIMSSPKYLNPI